MEKWSPIIWRTLFFRLIFTINLLCKLNGKLNGWIQFDFMKLVLSKQVVSIKNGE